MSRIPVQTAVFIFVNKYANHDYEFPSSIFEKISHLKKYNTTYGTTLEKLTLSKYEIVNQEVEVISNKRLLLALDQFSLMMIEYPISIFYSNGYSGEFCSKELFSLEGSLNELLANEFKSLNGKNVYVDELDYMKSYNRFFHIIDETLEERREFFAKIKKNAKSLCCLELFNQNANGLFELINQNQDDEAYQEDGSVSVFLQKTYNLSSTDANRFFIPLLKNLKI